MIEKKEDNKKEVREEIKTREQRSKKMEKKKDILCGGYTNYKKFGHYKIWDKFAAQIFF